MVLAAWLPADRLRRPHYVPAKKMPQLVLPANRLDWPAPSRGVDVDYFLGIGEGQTVVINGAAGAVGISTVQLARERGARSSCRVPRPHSPARW